MKIAIIGCGLIGKKRAEAALAQGHKIICVADTDPARAATLAEITKATALPDAKAVFASDVEAVVIATPHDQLAAIALAAVEAGKHVLLEKPGARTKGELQPVADAAKKHQRIVKVGFNHRFHPALLKAHAIFSAGEIGELMFIRGRYGHGGRIGYEKEWRCDKKISGGGELIDQGSHLIDLSRWFLGDLALDYASLPTAFWNTKVEDNCFLALQTLKKQMAWLHASWSEWKNMFSFEIYGRVGKLAIDGLGGSYGMEKLTHYQMLPEMGPPKTTVYEYPEADRSWDLEFAEFVSAIAEKRQPLGNIDDALAMLSIIDSAYKGEKP